MPRRYSRILEKLEFLDNEHSLDFGVYSERFALVSGRRHSATGDPTASSWPKYQAVILCRIDPVVRRTLIEMIAKIRLAHQTVYQELASTQVGVRIPMSLSQTNCVQSARVLLPQSIRQSWMYAPQRLPPAISAHQRSVYSVLRVVSTTAWY